MGIIIVGRGDMVVALPRKHFRERLKPSLDKSVWLEGLCIVVDSLHVFHKRKKTDLQEKEGKFPQRRERNWVESFIDTHHSSHNGTLLEKESLDTYF